MANNNIKVSIIIPVYNTEEYVLQAVDSIREQTLQELEIIIMNDGSTDGSLGILEELAKEDRRIQLYSQENQGQSVARNQGLEYAKGQYLYFMDSDDMLESDALKSCYEKCETERLDFVCFDAEILNKESALAVPLSYNRSKCLQANSLYSGVEMLQKQLDTKSYSPSPCLVLIRTAFFRDHHFNFYPAIIHEDQLLITLLHLKAQRVMYIHRNFFKRRFRNDSTMTRRFSWRNMKGYLTVSQEMTSFRSSQPSNIRLVIDQYLAQMLNAAVWEAHVLSLKERLRLTRICLCKYHKYVSGKTLSILLLKSFIHKK